MENCPIIYLYTDEANIPDNLKDKIIIKKVSEMPGQVEILNTKINTDRDIFPVLPQNRMIALCKNIKKVPLLDVYSVDYSIGKDGGISSRIITFTEGITIAKQKRSQIYFDEVSYCAYFCYIDNTDQHIVWLEEIKLLADKIELLAKENINKIAFRLTKYNQDTLFNLIDMIQHQKTT